MRATMSEVQQSEIERMWKLRDRAVELLGIVNAEWKSDPMAVQCFDLRIVSETNQVLTELDTLNAKYKGF